MSNDSTFSLQGAVSEQAQQMLTKFWPQVYENIKNLNAQNDYKTQELPLARIKKIMKLDEDVKMISAEAPMLFAKAAEIFVSELSLRAWFHTEENKRRTLQRNDIATAISKFDQFDFLIDIVPREELRPAKRQDELGRTGTSLSDQIQFYLQLGQQQQQQSQQQAQQQAAQAQVTQAATISQLQQTTVAQASAPAAQATTVQVPAGQMIQQSFQLPQSQTQVIQLPQQVSQTIATPTQATVLQQLQQQQQEQLQQVQPDAQQQVATQVYQQVVTANGQVQNIPIQLTPQQLQSLQLQFQSNQSKQAVSTAQQVVQLENQSLQLAQPQMYQLQQGAQSQIFIQSGDEQHDGGTDS